MSELHLSDSETRGFPARGPDAYLSATEQAFVQRILSHPESFPKAFWSAVMQKVALDGEPIPQSQVQGLNSFSVTVAPTIATSEITTSTSYTNLATVGPKIEGLRNGLYIAQFGCQMNVGAKVETARASLSTNGETPLDENAVVFAQALTTSNVSISTSRVVVVTLTNDNNNSLLVQYRVASGNSGGFSNRWMTAIRFGNA